MPPIFTDLSGAYAWLDSQVNYERVLGQVAYDDQAFELEGFRRRLGALGDPHLGLRTIHIAGTRGKGSAALTLEALLEGLGLRTAVYTSPHLHEYRERIRINGQTIGGEEFTRLMQEIADCGTEEVRRKNTAFNDSDLRTPRSALRTFKTVFENLTALFFLAARASGVDWAIVETGLGGRLDATNVLPPGPVLLTRIGLEHTHLLGDTLTQIAGEKAAILKPGGWAVAAAQDPCGEAQAVFTQRAAATGARLDWAPERCPIRRLKPHPNGLRMEIEFSDEHDHEDAGKDAGANSISALRTPRSALSLDLPIYGEFQGENIQNALAVLGRLATEGLIPHPSPDALLRALTNLRLPGRMEKVCDRPEVFADGGHCPTAAAALARTMAGHFGDRPAALLVGMMAEKDHDGFFRGLAAWPHWSWVGVYRVDSPRAAEAAPLAAAARRHFPQARAFENLDSALESYGRDADKKSRMVVTGSLYSVGRMQEWGSDHGSGCHSIDNPAQAQ